MQTISKCSYCGIDFILHCYGNKPVIMPVIYVISLIIICNIIKMCIMRWSVKNLDYK